MRSWAVTWRRYLIDLAPIAVKEAHLLRGIMNSTESRIHRYYEPHRHPAAPGLSLSGIQLVIPDHATGLPVLRTLSLCTCRRHYPGAASALFFARPPSRVSLPRKGCRVGLRIVRFEACSAFTHVAACPLALSPIRDTLPEGFSHFVASMTAPVASGWSDLPGGPCTHWRAPPSHGAHPEQTLAASRRSRIAGVTVVLTAAATLRCYPHGSATWL
jgi:hypothetical protein